MTSSRPPHKNKTAAALLALLVGYAGIHRIYLRGVRDRSAWLHIGAIGVSALLLVLLHGRVNWFYICLPALLSTIAGFVEALVIGLQPDEKFDAQYNAGSGRQSDSNWPLALVLVATMVVGATTLIATISRLFDLLYTGGAYG